MKPADCFLLSIKLQHWFFILLLYLIASGPAQGQGPANGSIVKLASMKFFARPIEQGFLLVDHKGLCLDSICYDSLSVSRFHLKKEITLLKAWKDRRFKLINQKGQAFSNLLLADVYVWNHLLCYAIDPGEYGLLDESGLPMTASKYSHFVADEKYGLWYAFSTSSNQGFDLYKSGGQKLGNQFLSMQPIDNQHYYLTDIDSLQYLHSSKANRFPLAGPYKHIGPFIDGFAIVTSGGQHGLIGLKGELLLPNIYKELKLLAGGNVIAQRQKAWVMNKHDTVYADELIPLGKSHYAIKHNAWWEIYHAGHQLLAFGLEEVYFMDNERFFIKKNGAWGLLDTLGRVLIPTSFAEIKQIPGRPYLMTQNLNGRYDLYNIYGKKLNTLPYQRFQIDAQYMLWAQAADQYQAFDLINGHWLKGWFDSIGQWNGSGYQITVSGRLGLLDRSGNWVIGPMWPKKTQFVDDTHIILHEGTYAQIIDVNGCSGQYLIFDSLSVSGPLVQVWRNGATGLMNIDGEVIFPLMAKTIRFSTEWYIWQVQNDTAFGNISRNGCYVSSFSRSYDSISLFEQNRALVKNGSGWGMIDQLGRLQIAPRYQQIRVFKGKEPRAAIRLQGQWGFIDEADQLIVQPYNDSVSDYRGSVALAYHQSHTELINLNGKKLIKLYEDYDWLPTGDLLFQQQGKWGVINHEGHKIYEALADDIKPVSENYFVLTLGSNRGLLDREGNWIVSPGRISEFKVNQENKVIYSIGAYQEIFQFSNNR